MFDRSNDAFGFAEVIIQNFVEFFARLALGGSVGIWTGFVSVPSPWRYERSEVTVFSY